MSKFVIQTIKQADHMVTAVVMVETDNRSALFEVYCPNAKSKYPDKFLQIDRVCGNPRIEALAETCVWLLTHQEFVIEKVSEAAEAWRGDTLKLHALQRAGFLSETFKTKAVAEYEYRKEHQIDSEGRNWHVLVREDDSVSLYYTRADAAGHFLVFDTLDEQPKAQENHADGRA